MTPLPKALGAAYEQAIAILENGPLNTEAVKLMLGEFLEDSRSASPDTSNLVFWRLVDIRHVETWDSGEGAFRVGGRWNKAGKRLLYASLDPATAILEVAVHKGFSALDVVPHMLVWARIANPGLVKVLLPASFPNYAWLQPGSSSPNQFDFVEDKMKSHPMLVLPSAVSTKSWNLLIDVDRAKGEILDATCQTFSLDTRLLKET